LPLSIIGNLLIIASADRGAEYRIISPVIAPIPKRSIFIFIDILTWNFFVCILFLRDNIGLN
ncbi:unnamed protein product, partial [marine sediment metagenome]